MGIYCIHPVCPSIPRGFQNFCGEHMERMAWNLAFLIYPVHLQNWLGFGYWLARAESPNFNFCIQLANAPVLTLGCPVYVPPASVNGGSKGCYLKCFWNLLKLDNQELPWTFCWERFEGIRSWGCDLIEYIHNVHQCDVMTKAGPLVTKCCARICMGWQLGSASQFCLCLWCLCVCHQGYVMSIIWWLKVLPYGCQAVQAAHTICTWSSCSPPDGASW